VPGNNLKLPLSRSHPKLAQEAYGWDPSTITSGVHQEKKWKCKKGHIWVAAVYARKKTGCPYCSGRLPINGVNDLKTLNPKLARELVNADATKLKITSHTRCEWKCKLGHIWTAPVSARSGGSGCPICAGKKILIGFNDLATTHPQIAKEAFGWDPRTTTAGKNIKRNWKCKKGHKWSVSVGNRTHTRSGKDSGCPICSGNQILKGFNDLRTLYPKLAKEAHGWDVTKIGSSSKKKLKWKCRSGHIYESTIGNRRRGDGCQFCSGRQCLTGFNDLRTTDPELAMQALGWDPTKITRGSGKKLKWKCNFGHSWIATPNTRTTSSNNASGCPGCEKTGFNPTKDAYLYLLSHKKWEMLQIGITNSPKSRLVKHRQVGWVQIDLIGPIPGTKAKEKERNILRYLKNKKVKFAHKAGGKKFDGWTESWIAKSYPANKLKDLITESTK
jgi:hypothetical protein